MCCKLANGTIHWAWVAGSKRRRVTNRAADQSIRPNASFANNRATVKGIDDQPTMSIAHTHEKMRGGVDSFNRQPNALPHHLVNEGERDRNAWFAFQHRRQIAIEGIVVVGGIALETLLFKEDIMQMHNEHFRRARRSTRQSRDRRVAASVYQSCAARHHISRRCMATAVAAESRPEVVSSLTKLCRKSLIRFGAAQGDGFHGGFTIRGGRLHPWFKEVAKGVLGRTLISAAILTKYTALAVTGLARDGLVRRPPHRMDRVDPGGGDRALVVLECA